MVLASVVLGTGDPPPTDTENPEVGVEAVTVVPAAMGFKRGTWIATFILQGIIRAKIFGAPFFVPLMPMTSAAFIVFTLYMIPDPATTPLKPSRQALFGFSVALVYALSQVLHIVFGLFFALLTVCAIRGVSMWALALWQRRTPNLSMATSDYSNFSIPSCPAECVDTAGQTPSPPQ